MEPDVHGGYAWTNKNDPITIFLLCVGDKKVNNFVNVNIERHYKMAYATEKHIQFLQCIEAKRE